MTSLERYLVAGRDAGCPRGQMENLARAGVVLQHDPNRPEDVLKVDADEDGIGGDDTADALRYLVATKARAVIQRKLSGVWSLLP